MIAIQPTLGTVLRRLIEEFDGAVDESYRRAGLEYRSRYTPIVRALAHAGPMTVRALARQATVSHSAASQTVAQMAERGLVSMTSGADARERIVALTPAAIAMLPDLRRCWTATEAAARTLDADLGQSLVAVLTKLLEALEERPFLDRILDQQPRSDISQ
jgi:DNA-binding MarR family transcriptional regulator